METGWRARQRCHRAAVNAYSSHEVEDLEFKVNLGYVARPRDLITTLPKEEAGFREEGTRKRSQQGNKKRNKDVK